MDNIYDENGFDKDGLHKNKTYYDEFGFDVFKRNREGLTFNQVFCRNGYDKEGYDKYGFNKEGINREGRHRDSLLSKINLEEEFNKVIGLENIKGIIKEQYNRIIAREIRRENGVKVDDRQSLNMIFTGNPGTGKTMAARLIGKLFKEFGILKEEKIVEVDRSMLVGQYQGMTAKKTREVFKSALGGILIVDEAYSLYNGEMDESGLEAINTIVKLIEDYRNEIVVILTGYKKEMNNFMKVNSGIKSRFSFEIEFNDYNKEELKEIFFNMIMERGFILERGINDYLDKSIELLKENSDRASGNGRMIRNFVENAIRRQSLRIAESKTKEGLNVIERCDIEYQKRIEETNLKDELEKIVGKKEIKEYLTRLNSKLKMDREKLKFGMVVEKMNNNLIFSGGVGTGKGIIAKTIGTIFYNSGILKTRNVIEVTRGDLVGSHIGQTAIKSRKVIEEAVGGVLFIDNAPSLISLAEGDFGIEAVNELINAIDNYGDKILIIISGDREGIERLLNSSIALKVRFKNILNFHDYSKEELVDILLGKLERGGYTLDLITLEKIKNYLENKDTGNNGRYVDELYERFILNMAVRLDNKEVVTKEDLMEIKEEDIY